MPLNSQPIQARSILRATSAPGDTDLLWLDSSTSPATLKQYDAVAGDWTPIASHPVSLTEGAAEWDEPEFTLHTDGTTAVDGGLELGGSAAWSYDESAFTSTEMTNPWRSSTFTFGVEVGEVRMTVAPSPGGTTGNVNMMRMSDNTQVGSATLGSPGTVHTFTGPFQADQYGFVFTGDIGFASGLDDTFTAGTNLRFDGSGETGGTDWGGTSRVNGLSRLEVDFSTEPDTATPILEPTATDVFSWDSVSRTLAPDGESVGVYIETSSDGGATWTEVAGPVSRGADIPVASDKELRFRVDLSRADTANNPRIESLYWRFTL